MEEDPEEKIEEWHLILVLVNGQWIMGKLLPTGENSNVMQLLDPLIMENDTELGDLYYYEYCPAQILGTIVSIFREQAEAITIANASLAAVYESTIKSIEADGNAFSIDDLKFMDETEYSKLNAARAEKFPKE